MQKAGWKIDQNEEACYITIDEEDHENDPDHEYSQWCDLPDLLLEEIFSYLHVKQRYYASLVCKNWYRGFHLPPVWSNFIVDDRTLTRAKYNYYSGWQYALDHLRTHNCLVRIGRYIKGLDFRPEHSFNNLFQFMTLMAWCIEKSQEEHCLPELLGIGAKIKSLSYVFPCNMPHADDPEGIKLYGTGGQLLSILKRLMSRLTNLKILKLFDLVLQRYEANHLLDEVLESCFCGLHVLYLVNITTFHCPVMHVGLFQNLQVLVITPQNIDDDIITLLADSKLKHFHIIQNRYTPIHVSPCSGKSWRVFKRDNPKCRVHIRIETSTNLEFVFQPEAPVYSIIYRSPKIKITTDSFLRIIDNYRGTLAIYGHELLPRFTNDKSFHTRIDSLMVLLTRQCFNLQTLVIREKVSTATVLLLACSGKNLQQFYVRRHAVIIRCDWPRNPEWSDEFHYWLKQSCKSYETTEKEVSQIFGRQWKFLNDKDFKKIQINVRQNL